jgi:spermidine/putrescine-binding protein
VIMAIKPDIAAFDSDTYEDNLLSGEFGLVHGWSGDIFTAQLEDENIDYAIPREGAVKWVDNLCITADAGADPARYERALKWIDFLNQPENAGANTNFVWYATPNMNATPYIDQEILDYEAVYPPEEVFAKLHWLEPIGNAIEIYDRACVFAQHRDIIICHQVGTRSPDNRQTVGVPTTPHRDENSTSVCC